MGHGKLDTATLVKGRRQLQLNGGVLTQALARGLLQATGTVGRTSKFVKLSEVLCTELRAVLFNRVGVFMGFSTHGSRWTLQDGTSWSTPKQEDSFRHGWFVEHGRAHFFQRRPVEERDVRFEVRYHEGVSEMGGWLVCSRSLG